MGGKSQIAAVVWSRFGEVRNFVEPFFGSGAVLLSRPLPFSGPETVNDINAWLCNFWRALQADPNAVAKHADWPVSELDLHARGDWLFYRNDIAEWTEQLRNDPNFFDAKSAGWWVWGQCCWICTGWGPRPYLGGAGRGVNRKRPHLGNAGRGINRQLPHLGDAGQGVNRQLPHLGDADGHQTTIGNNMLAYLHQLSERLRGVRICCGDWSRVCGPTPTTKQGLTAVFLDPPYGIEDRAGCYGADEDFQVSASVREWAIEQGSNPLMRIALCGYDGEHQMPDNWECYQWKARGGFGSQSKSENGNQNSKRERIWFSPHCCAKELNLFDALSGDQS